MNSITGPAYAYHEHKEVGLNCKIFIDEEFYEKFDPNKKESYDWSRIETVEADAVIGTRFVRYNVRDHISMENYLRKMDVKAKNKLTRIIIEDSSSKVAEFKLTNVTYELPPTPWMAEKFEIEEFENEN